MVVADVLAHGVGERADLPIPLFYAYAGAFAALVVSFLALGLLWADSRFRGDLAGRPITLRPPARPALARVAVRVLTLLAAVYTIGWLVLGPADENAGPYLVYVLFWVGLVPASLLFGPVWRALSPFRLLPDRPRRPYPAGLGLWPAAAGLLAFTWMELVAPEPAAPATLLIFLTLYAAAQLAGTLLYGHAWLERGDPFEVYSTLIGHLSPLGRRADGTRVLRSPFDGLDAVAPAPGLVATVCVLLGSTAYDGLSTSPGWVNALQSAPFGGRAGLGTLGLLAAVAGVAALYAACLGAAGLIGGTRGLTGRFAHSLLPIAVGYLIAHYFSLLVIEGRHTIVLALGLEAGADQNALAPGTIATVQVLAIVLGHVAGVVAAHDRSVRLLPPARAVAGQIPLFVLMVCYTTGGLTLLLA
ncbi:hypothetical protein HD597_006882 [Nonomuraea thailandensis]|uniref:Fenitrothion hydrolase n=1 Tax=Nonomuraea thailandensis TaxID=1188745 RepID=A0A9X2GLG6_9ACTN|nr:hypothetical protein [Nonomuraea thailandensis]MCP2359862.1 hypothetical protein [Nonomuraea thailandensis]